MFIFFSPRIKLSFRIRAEIFIHVGQAALSFLTNQQGVKEQTLRRIR
jgi:hypothetical protein